MAALKCHACGKTLSVRDELVGKRVKCPACKAVVAVPVPATANPSGFQLTELPTQPPASTRPAEDPVTAGSAAPDQKTRDSDGEEPDYDPTLTSFLAAKQSDDELGQLGGFRILKILGHGGMGVVFLGEDPKLGRKVAIKTMLPHLAARPKERERFLREARSAAALEHDHIVPIHHVGEDCGVPYIVMPFLRGQSLEDRLKEAPLSMPEIAQIAKQTASALAFAHKGGFVHRDVKPANLWLESRDDSVDIRVKILDFGLARLAAHDEQNLTQTGAMLGTPGYMAPEQADGRDVDGRADVFSLGCVLYRLTTGKAAFPGDSLMARLARLATHDPDAPHTLNPATPTALSDVIQKMLTKDFLARPTAAEALRTLHAMPAPADATQKAASLPPQKTVVVAPSTDDETQTLPANRQAAVPQSKSKSRVPLWIGLTLAILIGGVILIPQIVIRIRNKDGTETEIKLPKGAGVEIEKDGKTIAKIDPKTVEPPNPKLSPEVKPTPVPPAVKAGEEMTNSIGMKLVSIAPGKFLMGSPPEDKERQADEVQHEVEITRGFWLGKYEVTQEEYEKVMGSNPSHFKGPKLPVEKVSWDDAKEFCKKLSAKEGKEYTLPTEAEWEYACRAGTKGPFTTGENLTTTLANYDGESPYAGNAKGLNRNQTTEVGSFAANGYGLHDMHGNVWEWCEDWQGAYDTYGVAVDPRGAFAGSTRVVRGGSWVNPARGCRSAFRNGIAPSNPIWGLGFRVALRSVK